MLLHASETEEVSNAIVPDADVYENVGLGDEEAVELTDDARQEPDWPVLGH